VEVKQKSEV